MKHIIIYIQHITINSHNNKCKEMSINTTISSFHQCQHSVSCCTVAGISFLTPYPSTEREQMWLYMRSSGGTELDPPERHLHGNACFMSPDRFNIWRLSYNLASQTYLIVRVRGLRVPQHLFNSTDSVSVPLFPVARHEPAKQDDVRLSRYLSLIWFHFKAKTDSPLSDWQKPYWY